MVATLIISAPATAQTFGINTSSLIGSTGADEVTATEIQSDGTILVGGSFETAPEFAEAETIGSAEDEDGGLVYVISSDGQTVERALRVGASVHDMAVDEEDNIFIAAGSTGVVQLDPDLEWRRTKTVGEVYRVDAAGGKVVTLAPTNADDPHHAPGAGTITVLDAASGAEDASFPGYQNTLDVCLDGQSQTIGLVGWRAAAVDEIPTQVAFLRGYSLSGFTKWTGYDWGTELGSEDYINTPGDNADSTRGYRCSIGADGLLYAAFEADGADHLFRYSPTDVESPVEIVGGDDFHEFSNVRSEPKVFFARYEPADGSYLLGQQLVARVGDQDGNTVRVRRGAIEADADSNVYLVGESAYGLPIQFLPPGTGDYTGGAFLLSMNSDFSDRRYVTRITPSGAAFDVAAKPSFGDAGVVVYGGVHELDDGGFYAANPFQQSAGGPTDGFATIFGEGLADPDAGGGDESESSDDGCGCASTKTSPAGRFVLVIFVLIAAHLQRERRRP